MSVITELFENYDHIPLEFRRQLLMMRELDERSNKLIEERERTKKELLRKHPGESVEEEEQRIKRQYSDLQTLYERIDSISEEKIEITEKLFLLQENFIRKLDQQIQKTEEDKDVQERVDADHQKDIEEKETMAAGGLAQKGVKKQKVGRGASNNVSGLGFGTMGNLGSNWGGPYSGKDYVLGGLSMGDKGGKGDLSQTPFDSQNFGNIGGSKKNKIIAEHGFFGGSFGTGPQASGGNRYLNMIDQSSAWDNRGNQQSAAFGGVKQKRDRRDQKKGTGLGQTASSKRQTNNYASGGGGNQPFSQDPGLLADHNGADEDICFKCQKGGGENWVACDGCNKWFHILCLGMTVLPKDDETFYCPDCEKKENNAAIAFDDIFNEN